MAERTEEEFVSLRTPSRTAVDSHMCNPIFVTSTPSMMMVPEAGSMMRNRESSRDDFPEPVRPTIPIFSLGFLNRSQSDM